jgi:glycine/D-amino acid oxidase-like deaminating enzyme
MPRRVSVEVSPPRRIVICGGGVVGASTAYALVNHPSWRSDADSCTLVESTEIAAAASGKAGDPNCHHKVTAEGRLQAGGFLALDWHSKETQSLAALSFKVHSDLAEQHDGATRWGFRKIETYSVSFDETRDKFRKVVPDIPWLDTGIITQSKRIGASTNTAQCEPKLFTQALVQVSCLVVHSMAKSSPPDGSGEGTPSRLGHR